MTIIADAAATPAPPIISETPIRTEPGAAERAERMPALMRWLWDKTGGKDWEPPRPDHWIIVGGIAAGYLRRIDGLCMFERLRDAMVAWTDAGRAAMVAETRNG